MQRYSTFFRLISIILTVALLMTTVGVNSIAEAVVGVIAAMAVHTVLKHRNLS